MKNIIYYIIMVIVMVTLTGCPEEADYDRRLWIYNGSGKNIFEYDRINTLDVECSDTLLPSVKRGGIIKNNTWDITYINFWDFSCDTMRIFIISPDTLEKYSWEKIREDNNILKRYDLSRQDLDRLNWTIYYP